MFGSKTCHYCYILDYHNDTLTSVFFLGIILQRNSNDYCKQQYVSMVHFFGGKGGRGVVPGLEHHDKSSREMHYVLRTV